jgi:hypothetical protein
LKTIEKHLLTSGKSVSFDSQRQGVGSWKMANEQAKAESTGYEECACFRDGRRA